MSDAAKAVLQQHADELTGMGVWVELGRHTLESIEDAELVITSPGIPDSAKPLVWARERGIPVISEIEFAVRHTNAKIVAITGTNGKTTTTSLVGHILTEAGMPHVVAGNIGQPLSSVVDKTGAGHIVVLEMSSFQLETVESFHPHIAVWLNITPDHLDRYGSMEAYFAAKARIFNNMTSEDWAIIWEQNREETKQIRVECPARKVWIDERDVWRPASEESYGAWCADGILYSSFNRIVHEYGERVELPLRGDHNCINMLAACAVCRILRVPNHIISEALKTFSGLPHRIEFVIKKHGISFLNDSKATNVDAMIEALRAVPGPVSLIAGGYDKGGDFSKVLPFIREKAIRVVLLGAAREKLEKIFKGVTELVSAECMADAVAAAARNVPLGTTVLLSPGCASFDLYDDFEQRGDDFKECARRVAHMMDNHKHEVLQ